MVKTLTERQRRIADLVAEGLSEPQIGERLGLSRFTIRNHKQVIYNKLGVNNAVEMTRVLLDTQLSQPPEKIPA
jgi:DNA-binding NarL/FixJ family response regulator